MCLVVALVFWILGDTAERYFCPVVRTLADRWNLAPATAGVTLLALGNGAPDVFASLAAAAAAAGATAAAGAIVSAGMFVSGAVVGAVALVAAPFPVDPRPFRRDVSCYLAAVIVTAVVVADGKVHAWEAAALPAYYVAFVGYVVWCDARTDPGAKEPSSTASRLVDRARRWFATRWREREGGSFGFGFGFGGDSALRRALDATTLVCLVAPLEVARRATIPCGDPKRWNRFYACANAALSPLLLTHLVVSFSGLELGFGGSLGSGGLEFAVGVGMASFAAAAVLWRVTADDAPPRWWDANGLVDAVAFLCSVAWIAAAARELTECLAAIGDVLGVTPASLSVTVLAIGNSLGDLAADVATARSGQPTMAVAACFSGPLFNMAVGLGGSFAIATWGRGGDPLPLAMHPTVAVGFVFLIVGLVATASLVPMRGYVVTRGHGYGLIALYVTYMACAVAVEVLTDGGGGGTMSESAPARWR
ncbi:Ca2+:Cation antiporter family [Micromonas commoda]|uniref:Ca2+:Cation antiporter family n=1 Tax=Micromonas commoda (strain RCC299 / NOUM17 / CCMP2709) TaxID=296587 RepID=C1E5U4_MICCC|nr:Ca2+:Cation antiporter family [Micromonas commoda]ACO63315.1 Ca2+:Cation antiporter family [Micromonas commoda]|eukprot:XP_002502057.1 Ca2+:Cation antiporter family [Micromonas commoda]